MATLPEGKTLPARLESLSPLMGFVTACARKQGFGETRIRELELVIEELLVNVFSYAYPLGPGEVAVTCREEAAGRLLVEIADQGIPFDPLAASPPDREAGIEERGIGGLGVFFVKHFVSDVRYRREGERNILTLAVDPAPVGSP